MCIRLKKWTWQAKSLLDCLKSIIKHLKVKNRHLSEVVVIMNSSQKLWNNHSYFKSHFLVAKPIKSIFKRKKVKLFLNVLNHFLYFFLSSSAFTSISILIRSAKKNTLNAMERGRGRGFRGGNRGDFRGGNRNSGNGPTRANLPFNREGRIAPYSKEGGRGRRGRPGASDQNRFKNR